MSVEGQKRTLSESPKSIGIETKNSFSLLDEESSPAKKKVAGTSGDSDHSNQMDVYDIHPTNHPEKS